jgi:hypothetical protein
MLMHSRDSKTPFCRNADSASVMEAMLVEADSKSLEVNTALADLDMPSRGRDSPRAGIWRSTPSLRVGRFSLFLAHLVGPND